MRAAIVALVLASSSSALAESVVPHLDSGPQCTYGSPDVAPPAGAVPANWPAFTIAMFGTYDRSTMHMTRVSDGHEVPLRFGPPYGGITYVPMEALVVGESYLVEHPACGTAPLRTTMYDVIAPVTAPTTLGTVEVHGPFASNIVPGTCHRHYFLDVVITPDPAFASAPWSAFEWGTAIDGVAPISTMPMTTTHQRIGLPCGEPFISPTTAEGHHDFVVSAGPPGLGSPSARMAAPISLDALCDAAVRVDDPTLRPLNPIEIMSWDTDMDGSCSPPDAATDLDAHVPMDAASAVDGGAHTEPDTRPNCACGVARGPASVWPFVLVALAALSRRRR